MAASKRPRPTGGKPRLPAPAKGQTVAAFLHACEHPLRDVLDAVRGVVQAAEPRLQEGIAWRAPSFALDGAHRITCNLAAADRVRLVFHTGARSAAPRRQRVVADDGGLLQWAALDRGIATFRSVAEVTAVAAALRTLVRAWLRATT
jgi:hypothetical protein